jgi:3D (Asp-Asp-Asp) domain-containing protein
MKIPLFIFIFLPQSLSYTSTSCGYQPVPECTQKVVNEEVVLVSENVTLTTYSANVAETDSTPNITASGFKIDDENAGKHRIVAISRDLKRQGWKFNKKVKVSGAGKYNGIYTIKDLMNGRHRKRVDILIDKDDKHTKMKNIKITLLD